MDGSSVQQEREDDDDLEEEEVKGRGRDGRQGRQDYTLII